MWRSRRMAARRRRNPPAPRCWDATPPRLGSPTCCGCCSEHKAISVPMGWPARRRPYFGGLRGLKNQPHFSSFHGWHTQRFRRARGHSSTSGRMPDATLIGAHPFREEFSTKRRGCPIAVAYLAYVARNRIKMECWREGASPADSETTADWGSRRVWPQRTENTKKQ
jgi:hypothetical protein